MARNLEKETKSEITKIRMIKINGLGIKMINLVMVMLNLGYL